MQLARLLIPVPLPPPDAPERRERQLLALLATSEPSPPSPHDEDEAAAFDEVLVYLHGFPDLAVHPARVDFASRMPRKLAEFWLQGREAPQRRAAFVTFNFGGVPGSDTGTGAGALHFADKTVGQEVEDAAAVCRFVRARLLRKGGGDRGEEEEVEEQPPACARLHVVGLSTGAIVAALLRAQRGLCASITAIAGLLDVAHGVQFDFSPRQLAQVEEWGYCWKEFYLPAGCALPQHAELSFDGETRASSDELIAWEGKDTPQKLFMRLNRRYVDECLDGSLDVRSAVDGSSSLTSSSPLPPLLVIHGTADQNVPLANGEALFAAAAPPKTLVAIPKANHLLSSAKHLKRALQALRAHTRA